MRTAIVFGAGGAAGWVYHSSVAATLAAEIGLQPAESELLIGTSAGAAVAAGVRAGAEPGEMVQSISRGPSEEERREYQKVMAGRKRSLRPLQPSLAVDAFRSGTGIAVAVAGMLPAGWFPTYPLGRFPGVNGHTDWPAGLWITAVDVNDGRPVVFGKDVCDVPVSAAVEASSAVPGMFTPKEINGRTFVDGGLASPTHADLALEDDPDLVIVSSLMSRPSRRPMSVLARRRLAPELERLAEAGVPTVVVEPEEAHREALKGFPRRNPEAAGTIAQLAQDATRKAFESSSIRGL